MLRPVAVNTRRQAFDAVDVKIEADETSCGEIGEEALLCGGENSRKLREGDRLAPTPEVKSGTPGTNDVAETMACGNTRRQADFPSPGHHRLAKRGDGGLRAEFRSGVDSFNQWTRFLLLRQPVGLTSKHNRLDGIQHPHGNRWAVNPDD